MTGPFISVDGIDGGGKSTQIKLLQAWYEDRGRKTRILRDPGGTTLGESLREILLHRQDIPLDMTSEMLLYMASRAQLVAEVVRPALDSGEVVIADRYLMANVAYQGWAGGIAPDTVWQVGLVATGGLLPDLTFLLDLPPQIGLARIQGGMDRLESRGLPYMEKVRDGFLQEAKSRDVPTHIIDAQAGVDEVHAQIVSVVESQSQ